MAISTTNISARCIAHPPASESKVITKVCIVVSVFGAIRGLDISVWVECLWVVKSICHRCLRGLTTGGIEEVNRTRIMIDTPYRKNQTASHTKENN